MQIGCKQYKINEWREFSDEEISAMNGRRAIDFWHKWKDVVLQIVDMSTQNDDKGA